MLWFPWARSGPGDRSPQDLQRQITAIQIGGAPPVSGFGVRPTFALWEIPGWDFGGSGTQIVTADRIAYVPIRVHQATSYDRVGVSVSALAAGSSIDVRLFDDLNGLPGPLRSSLGVLATTANGAVEAVIALTLPVGNYWLAWRPTGGTPTMDSASTTLAFAPAGSVFTTNATLAQGGVCLLVDAAYADPGPAPTANFGANRNAMAGVARLRRV